MRLPLRVVPSILHLNTIFYSAVSPSLSPYIYIYMSFPFIITSQHLFSILLSPPPLYICVCVCVLSIYTYSVHVFTTTTQHPWDIQFELNLPILSPHTYVISMVAFTNSRDPGLGFSLASKKPMSPHSFSTD